MCEVCPIQHFSDIVRDACDMIASFFVMLKIVFPSVIHKNIVLPKIIISFGINLGETYTQVVVNIVYILSCIPDRLKLSSR